MLEKSKEFIIGWFVLGVLVLVITGSVSTIRSTKQVYVCSGSFLERGKAERQLNVKFEIENSYSGIPWSDSHFMSVKMFDNAPYVFYHSLNALGDGHNLIWHSDSDFHWSRTSYGKDLDIWVSRPHKGMFNPAQMLSFDFQTKILEATEWEDEGKIVAANYNMICKEVK